MKTLVVFLLLLLVADSDAAALLNRRTVFRTTAATVPDPDIAWWKLNEGSGTAISSTVAGTGGTTDASWVTGKSGSGYALDFTGSPADGASTNTITYGTNKITLAFWMYMDATNNTRIAFETTADYNSANAGFVVYHDANTLNWSLHSGTGYRTVRFTPPAVGAWHHYLGVFDNTTAPGVITVWVDGASQSLTSGDNNSTGASTFVASTLYIGARNQTSYHIDARIDDVRIWKGDQSAHVAAVYADPQ